MLYGSSVPSRLAAKVLNSGGLTMDPHSPTEALGADASGLRDLLVDLVQSRHNRAAEAYIEAYSQGEASGRRGCE